MLDFLASATIEDVAEVTKVHNTVKKNRIPEGLALRIFRDGSVYPSLDAVKMFNLEYPKAVVTKEAQPLPIGAHAGAEPEFKNVFTVEQPGFGFDIVDTDKAQANGFKFGKRVLLISPVSRSLPKVDLFASTTYQEDGTPRSTITDQGAKTFGSETLLPMIKEVYGLELTKEGDVDFIDLQFVAHPTTGLPWKPNRDVIYIPKQINRGKDKGAYTTVRRELPVFYVLYPTSLIEAEIKAKAQQTDAQLLDEKVEHEAVSAEVAAPAVHV